MFTRNVVSSEPVSAPIMSCLLEFDVEHKTMARLSVLCVAAALACLSAASREVYLLDYG